MTQQEALRLADLLGTQVEFVGGEVAQAANDPQFHAAPSKA